MEKKRLLQLLGISEEEYDRDIELVKLLGLKKWYERPKRTENIGYNEGDDRNALVGQPVKYITTRYDDWFLKDINLISAPLGMGKTHMFLGELKGTVCVISPRKYISKAFANDSAVDMVYYLTDDGKARKDKELMEAENLSIVINSVHRLISEIKLKAYDNLIIDELELVLPQSVSNISRQPQDTEDAFRDLLTHSKKVFGLGWLFRDYTINYLQSLGRSIYYDYWHRDIATDIELNVYETKEHFFENLNDVAKSQRVLLFTDRAKDIKTIADNIEASTEYYYAHNDFLIPREKEMNYADTEKIGMTSQVEIFSPIVSHGYNFRNETPRTALLLLNTTERSRMSMTDLVQFMFRNRDQKVIDLYMWTPDEKEIDELEQIATGQQQFTSEQIRTYGKYDPIERKKIIDHDDEIVKRLNATTNIARVEKASCRSTLFLYLRWLGLTNINFPKPKEKDCVKKLGVRTSPETIFQFGKFLQPAEYFGGTIDERRYTDICKDFGVEELTQLDIERWDNGNFKDNELRQRQMFENKTIRDAHEKNKGIFAQNKQFGLYQFLIGKYMKNKQTITNAEFKQSDYWQKALEYEYIHNQTMRKEGLPELCIKPDDKVRPLLYLKRFLEKHNFHCVIEKPNKDDKPRIRKEAEKSCRKEYLDWKQKQQPIIQLVKKLEEQGLAYWDKQLTKNKLEELKKKIDWCGYKNIRIEHYLDFLISNGEYEKLTNEMKALRLIADTWVMTIEEYES